MQRYFIARDNIVGETITLSSEPFHHIKNVMRCRVGDELICCDSMGTDYRVKISALHSNKVVCDILERVPSLGESRLCITVAQALPKADKFELVLQKCTELGAFRFLPFYSERTLLHLAKDKVESRMNRWAKIVAMSSQQAQRGLIPELAEPLSWKELLGEIKSTSKAYLLHVGSKSNLADLVLDKLSCLSDIMLIIGPEGGFTEAEVAEASLAGAEVASLGSRVLRTETAALAALAGIFFVEDMNDV